ncbi:hypothetical protein IQ07DRAFT_603582 [Pyrenochaeta sp. DS3sAY3a]|nr:hypothetical protein IQ07DRAFT_603582 [Pyrenochaeta sp. DS3sAY3a]
MSTRASPSPAPRHRHRPPSVCRSRFGQCEMGGVDLCGETPDRRPQDRKQRLSLMREPAVENIITSTIVPTTAPLSSISSVQIPPSTWSGYLSDPQTKSRALSVPVAFRCSPITTTRLEYIPRRQCADKGGCNTPKIPQPYLSSIAISPVCGSSQDKLGETHTGPLGHGGASGAGKQASASL